MGVADKDEPQLATNTEEEKDNKEKHQRQVAKWYYILCYLLCKGEGG